ncbi:hypothetical protein PGB90_005068 [Kerria lacca]
MVSFIYQISLNNANFKQRSAFLEQKRNKIQEKVEKLEKKKRRKKKREKNNIESNGINNIEQYIQYSHSVYSKSNRFYKMAENVNDSTYQNGNGKSSTDIAIEIEEQDKKEREERRKQREPPPIVFPNSVILQEEFDKVIGLVDGNIPQGDMQFFEELHQYMLEDEGSWALSDGFLSFVGKLLNDQNFSPELRVRLLNVLAVAALKEDIILVLHQDRREHVFMNYAYNFDRISIDEQKSLALFIIAYLEPNVGGAKESGRMNGNIFVCNLFENPSSSEWLLYISEWDCGSGNISNIRVTTKIAENSLLSENEMLQNYGSAIVHNLACKEVFDDVAVELTMAILQFFNSKPDEEKLFRCMKALAKFIQVSQQDVSQLIQMIGPKPEKFREVSERINMFITVIESKLH